MRKVFQHVINQVSACTKIFFNGKTLAIQKLNQKTESKAYLAMPMAFDFTAYFDDNEFEDNPEDISHENPKLDTNTEVHCMNNETGNEKLYLSNIPQFECCIN